MGAIERLKVLRDIYRVPKKEYDYIHSDEKSKVYKLKNEILPVSHSIDFAGADILVVKGDNGVGKTTFLLELSRSIKSRLFFEEHGFSIMGDNNRRGRSVKLPYLTDWARELKNDPYTIFSCLMEYPLFYTEFFKIVNKDIKDEDLVTRINKNSGVSQEKVRDVARYLLNESNSDYGELLKRMCYVVEAGTSMVFSKVPEMMFGNYQLFFRENIAVSKLDAEYIDFKKVNVKGMSDGEAIKKEFERISAMNLPDTHVLCLDEPSKSLSQNGAEYVAEIIKSMKVQSFVATHDQNLA
ncbi:MAG: hypothetical protein ACP5N3_06685, partial [Candidatus Nanoarchaeia archaeon]